MRQGRDLRFSLKARTFEVLKMLIKRFFAFLLQTRNRTARRIIPFIKNWIIGKCNSRVFIGLAIMVYEPLYHDLQKLRAHA